VVAPAPHPDGRGPARRWSRRRCCTSRRRTPNRATRPPADRRRGPLPGCCTRETMDPGAVTTGGVVSTTVTALEQTNEVSGSRGRVQRDGTRNRARRRALEASASCPWPRGRRSYPRDNRWSEEAYRLVGRSGAVNLDGSGPAASIRPGTGPPMLQAWVGSQTSARHVAVSTFGPFFTGLMKLCWRRSRRSRCTTRPVRTSGSTSRLPSRPSWERG